MRAFEQKAIAVQHRDGIEQRLDFAMAWTCPWEEIADYPITPTSAEGKERPSRVQDDEWLLPTDWCPPNRWDRQSRTIDFKKVVPLGWDTVAAEGLKRRVKRIALLDWTTTLRVGPRAEISSPPVPTSWARKTRLLLVAVHHAVETYKLSPAKNRSTPKSGCPDGTAIFSLLAPKDFVDLITLFPAWSQASTSRLNGLYSFGLMDDWPANDVARPEYPKRHEWKGGQPLSDTAFTEIVRAALWLSALTDEVLVAYLRVAEITNTPNGQRRSHAVGTYRTSCVRTWVPAAMRPGDPLRYMLRLHGRIHHVFPLEASDFRSLEDLLLLCQTANVVLTLASTGMRIGELTGLRPDALRWEGERCYLDGPSFKSNDSAQGELRSWPIPQLAADAFERQRKVQIELARTDHLWITLAGAKNDSGVPDLRTSVTSFGDAVLMLDGRQLSALDGKVTSHRFRYTVTRLVALSLEGATQVMFDVLGHSDVEVTLGYVHRDPELLENINKVRREVRAVRVKEVFNHADEHGGRAAEFIRKIRTDLLARSGKQELDTENVLEAANILGACEVVRPGVLCTAQPLERGACSSNLAIRDFAACSTACLYRLELAAKRADRRKNLDFMLTKIAGVELFERLFLQNQIIANLQPFPDLIDELAVDPRLRAALGDCDQHRWAALEPDLRERLGPILGKKS